MWLLLDTHILLWAMTDDPKLSTSARKMIDDLGNVICYSVVSVWEIAIKHAAHPDNVSFSGKVFAAYCEEAGFQEVALRAPHVYALEYLSRKNGAPPHRDPFDKILIAQAKAENMLFLTHDASLLGYDEPCIVLV